MLCKILRKFFGNMFIIHILFLSGFVVLIIEHVFTFTTTLYLQLFLLLSACSQWRVQGGRHSGHDLHPEWRKFLYRNTSCSTAQIIWYSPNHLNRNARNLQALITLSAPKKSNSFFYIFLYMRYVFNYNYLLPDDDFSVTIESWKSA